ncbi:MAG TPA: class I SAM-dependent methyltransferase [Streptosporangiaceae bacterium]
MTLSPLSKDWEAAYAANSPAMWDIGRPQPAFVRLAESGLLRGRVLDVGCGTGEHALLAAAHGAEAVGVDISARAIEQARSKAAKRGITASFQVADALSLSQLGMVFDTVIDSATFHVFDNERRARYVTSLASVLRSGGTCYLMCFSVRQCGDFDFPRRLRKDELLSAFRDGWAVTEIVADTFDLILNRVMSTGQAWRATIRRL